MTPSGVMAASLKPSSIRSQLLTETEKERMTNMLSGVADVLSHADDDGVPMAAPLHSAKPQR